MQIYFIVNFNIILNRQAINCDPHKVNPHSVVYIYFITI